MLTEKEQSCIAMRLTDLIIYRGISEQDTMQDVMQCKHIYSAPMESSGEKLGILERLVGHIDGPMYSVCLSLGRAVTQNCFYVTLHIAFGLIHVCVSLEEVGIH